MITTLDLTTPGKDYRVNLIKPKEPLIKKINDLIPAMFLGSTEANQRRLILRYREQEQGIDLYWNQVFKTDANKDAMLTMSGLTSMMIFNFTQIVTARYYDTFVPDTGEYVRVTPQRVSSIEPAKALTHLINYYLRQNKYQKHIMYDIFHGTVRDGVAISHQFWNYKQITQKLTRQPRQKWNPLTSTYEDVNDVTVLKSIPYIDRPEMRYVDPLMFGVPSGTRWLDVDARMCCQKEIFTRGELLALEKRGYIQGFSKLDKEEVGDHGSSSAEAPEMRLYYQDLFNSQLNERLEWDDLEYKYVVDKFYISASEEEDMMCYWLVGGHIIRAGIWEGGHELPYTIYNYSPVGTTWMGMGIPEIVQDYYREDNILTKQTVSIARKAGKMSLLVPRDTNLTQVDMSKLTEEGGVVMYDDSGDGIPFNQKVMNFSLGNTLENVLKPRDDIRTQAGVVAGINLTEIAGADLPSNFRSDKLVAGLGAQSSRPAQMILSMMGEHLSSTYEQIKNLVYRLQDEPVEIFLGDSQTPIISIDPESLDKLPETMAIPNIYSKKIDADMFQILVQMLPYIQSASTPVGPDQAYNFGKVLDTVIESALGPEQAKILESSKGTGLPQTFTDIQMAQNKSPGGNNRAPSPGPQPLGM